MSVLQRANEGPNGMLLMYAKAWLKSHKNTVGFLTLLLMVIINLASQLFSTALLSDFQRGEVPGKPVRAAVYYAMSDPPKNPDFKSRPNIFPVFAENPAKRNTTIIDGRGPSAGLFDSGLVCRAFLPVSADVRTAIKSYTGPGNIPEMHHFCAPIPLKYSWDGFAMNASLQDPPPQLKSRFEAYRSTFNLSGNVDWTSIYFNQCHHWIGEISICEPLDKSFNTYKWSLIFKSPDNPTATNSTVYQDEWAIQTFDINNNNSGLESRRMMYTACARKLGWGDGDIKVGAEMSLMEPTISISINQDRYSKLNPTQWNTSAIQRVLGVCSRTSLNSTAQERRIWSLYSYPKPLPGPKLGASTTGTYYGDPLQKVPSWNWCIGPHGMALRTSIDGKQTCYIEQQLNVALLALFNNTFYDTGRIALAMEATITVLHSNAYYQNQPLFTEKSDAVIQQFVGETHRRDGWALA
ncbi:hypothetical protein FPQ18DRAFT_311118 [Pyronema domesticum]|nr:hypothetical protein FPQ18DRAFT_311118 [Pyronema domesticum]